MQKEAKNNFKKKFCGSFAPEKGKELQKVLSSFPSSEFESDVPESCEHIVRAIKVQ